MKSIENDGKCLWMVYLAVWLISGCGPSTKISASWKNPSMQGSRTNLLVVALTDNETARQTVEETFESILEESGVEAAKSGSLFSADELENFASNRDTMLEKIRDNGMDGILTVALLDQQASTRHTSKVSGYYSPSDDYDFYGGFHSYYNHYTRVVKDPGYYTQNRTYFLESNLYDVETEELLWSAQSQIYEPSNLESFARTFANITVARMKGEDIID